MNGKKYIYTHYLSRTKRMIGYDTMTICGSIYKEGPWYPSGEGLS